MDRITIALIVGIGCGLLLGTYVARKSSEEEAIQGGWLARIFHYLGSASIGGVVPVVLTSLVLGLGFRTAFPLGISFLLVAWIALLVYAIFEHSAQVAKPN